MTPEARRKKALGFALAGVDWEVIAVECGYANRTEAVSDIEEALAENPVDALSPAATRSLQMARLSRLLASVWSAAINGNNRAAEVSSSLIRQMMKAQGIEDKSDKTPLPDDPNKMSAYDELAARRPGSLGGPRRESNGRRRGRGRVS